jgi:hypothetical protein
MCVYGLAALLQESLNETVRHRSQEAVKGTIEGKTESAIRFSMETS